MWGRRFHQSTKWKAALFHKNNSTYYENDTRVLGELFLFTDCSSHTAPLLQSWYRSRHSPERMTKNAFSRAKCVFVFVLSVWTPGPWTQEQPQICAGSVSVSGTSLSVLCKSARTRKQTRCNLPTPPIDYACFLLSCSRARWSRTSSGVVM